VARARGTGVEHVERADALRRAAQDDARVERWGERICDSRALRILFIFFNFGGLGR
jgi:hypothetical protein